jgi:hypothetical protein
MALSVVGQAGSQRYSGEKTKASKYVLRKDYRRNFADSLLEGFVVEVQDLDNAEIDTAGGRRGVEIILKPKNIATTKYNLLLPITLHSAKTALRSSPAVIYTVALGIQSHIPC